MNYGRSLWLLIGQIVLAHQGFAQGLSDAYQNFNADHYEQAAKQFKDYSQGHPQDFDQLYNTGVALYQQGQLAEAQQYFDKARQSPDPKLKAKAAYNKGMALIGQKKLAEAESSLQEALSYDNENKIISANLAWVKEAKNRQDPPQPDQPPSAKDSRDQQQKDAEQKPDQQQENQQNNKQETSENKTPGEPKSKPDSAAKSAPAAAKNAASQDQGNQPQKSPAPPKQAQSEAATQAKPPLTGQSAAKEPKNGTSPAASKPGAIQADKVETNQGKAAQQTLTLPDLKQQEAEKLLRSVEDRLGRYTLTPEQADMEGKSKNGKAW